MNVLKFAAFSQNGQDGNPAGVVFCDAVSSEDEMLKIAKHVGWWQRGDAAYRSVAGLGEGEAV
jgi:hypothetical protein